MKTILILSGLILLLAGCSIQHKLNRDYKGKTARELTLGLGKPTTIEKETDGRAIYIYVKKKALRAAVINTGAFQYDTFESPRSVKTDTFKFYLDGSGIVENATYEVSYER